MPVDPPIAAILDRLANSGTPLSMIEGSPQQAREHFRAMTAGTRDPATLAQVRAVSDSVIDGPAGDIRLRTYRPDADGAVPTVLYLHGGGFVVGDLDTQDDHARIICRDVGAVVVSVDYRLAPEHPFPCGLDDCLAATRWAAAHVAELGGDADSIAGSGDSAGGNLASSVAIACARAANGPKLAAQLLLYPGTDFRDDDHRYPSRIENGEGMFLTLADMHWFSDHYLSDDTQATDPRASLVLTTDLTGLPPALVVTAEYDPLRDEGEAYAALLANAGVTVVQRRVPGMIHGFFGWGPWSPAAAAAIADICAEFRALLA